MIDRWALFNYHEINNTLLILFSDKKENKIVRSGEVDLLYNDNELVGYRIEGFIRYAKIKYSGIIFMPNDILVDVINSVLVNSKVEPLSYKKESGYIFKEMENNKVGVYALEGTFLRDESVSKGRFCTYHDLYIDNENPNNLIIEDNKNLIGHDFFVNKEK